MKTLTSLKALCAVAGVAVMAAAMPAHAQQMVDEITVEGYQGRLPDNVKRAATVVSYADLDLSTHWGRDELRKRVRLTARYLCDKLGETDTSSGVVPSCRDHAYRDTMRRVGTIEANAVPRGAAWVQPPAWAAPYPAAWEQETTTYEAQPATYQTQPTGYQTRTETRTYQSPGYPAQTTTRTTETRTYQQAPAPAADPYVEY